jgi:methyl-accepting chemotaxis protein
VSEIAAASAEQSTGIDQVNTALTQMDEVTQQNSALVEENAATAKTLEQQAQAVTDRVSFFQLGDAASGGQAQAPVVAIRRPAVESGKRPVSAPKRAAAPAKRGVVGRMQAALATAFKQEPEWKEF